MLLFGLASYPAVVDFGPVDVHAPAAVRTATVTNTSDSGIDLGPATHAGASAFTFSPLPATHLPPGESVSVTVTYDPSAEETDTGSLVIPIAGSSPATIAISGRGIDRHIMVTEPVFPPAYRNAGDMAPVVPVTLTNTGEASLAVSSIAITGGPVWQLVHDDPVDIPGGTSFDVLVRFSPTEVGPAPDGALLLHDDDATQPVIRVPLHGTGVMRAVTFGPTVFDLGYTGIGEPLAVPGALAIESADTATFEIQSVTVDDPRFAVSPGAPLALPAGATQPLDVTFTASEPGDYHTTATLFLDQDPTAQATVVLQAHAVFIDAQGGGGCSAGGDAGGGALLAVAALLLLRRRRALALVLVPAVASADDRNVDLSVFDPTPATVQDGFQLATPAIGERGELSISTLLDYANRPLVLASSQNEDVAIANRMTVVVGGAYAVNAHLELGAHMPMMIQNGEVIDPKTEAGTPAVGGDARGNLALHAKAQLVRSLGALAVLELPTASDDRFAGTHDVAARLLALSSFEVSPRVSLTFDFGAALRSEAHFANITERSAVAWGIGGVYRADARLSVTGELYGELVPGGHRDAMGEAGVLATTELLAGAHYQLDPLLSIGVALGRGVIGGPGAPAFRGLVTFAYAPRLGQPRVVHVAPPPALASPSHAAAAAPATVLAEPDADRDGIADARDACPAAPERINGTADDDGCPDAGDGAVVITPDRLELLEPISDNVLGQIGATLRAHPEITHLTIIVRASTGDDSVAQHRARALAASPRARSRRR
jgi:uncharacterized protein (TIGR03382 family)